MSRTGVKEMSSNLLRMRFMNRQSEAERREQLRKEEETRLLQARWVVQSADKDHNVILVLSEDRFDLSPPIGRRSFRNFNPMLETLVVQQMREHKQSESRKVRKKKRGDRSDVNHSKVVLGRHSRKMRARFSLSLFVFAVLIKKKK